MNSLPESPLAHTPKRWIVQPDPEGDMEGLAKALDIAPMIARILASRGMADPASCKKFLNPSIAGLHPPESLANMKEAVALLREACENRARICVYGDYDADGCTGTAILVRTLTKLGGDAHYYTPHRISMGYGLHEEAITEIHSTGATVLISVDCGITGVGPVRLARELGMKVIVTDHHEFGDELPNANAILHPRLPGKVAPFEHLSGAGVAFKLAWGLTSLGGDSTRVRDDLRSHIRDCMALAAVGTIVDVVPLIDENRVITRFGLEHLRKSPWPGIHHLLDVAGISPDKPIKGEDVAYKLGPRLNALGRLGCARLVVEMLTTDQSGRAKQIALVLDKYNQERQTIERAMVEEAKEEVEKTKQAEASAIVLFRKTWTPGVVGIVASRMVETFGRPVLMLGKGGEGTPLAHLIVGSGRTTPGIHLKEALDQCRDLLVSGGGHAAAVGLKLIPENLDALRERFQEAVTKQRGGAPIAPELRIEAEVPLLAMRPMVIRMLDGLEPFGSANPRPLYMATGLKIDGEPRLVGKDANTLQVYLKQGETRIKAVGFHMGSRKDEMLSGGGDLSLAFSPSINEYQGRISVDLHIKDFQPVAKPVFQWEPRKTSWETPLRDR